jgi:hypothetical protein
MPDFISLTLFVGTLSLSSPSAVPSDQVARSPMITAAAASYPLPVRPLTAPVAPPNARGRDSLKNGAIIGAVSGGALGALAGAYGCALGGVPDAGSGEPSCGSDVLVGAALGAIVGAFIGVGIDALFERAPHPAVGAEGRRIGVRLKVRF